ncbi:MAG TPA: P1 family peptidase [Acetobacteraceae bacterium]|nr:P1 family peptidase [Acetobacteraceae bacterium]
MTVEIGIPGVAVGHATDPTLGSGVTAIVFDAAAVAAVMVLGGAPGGRDTDLLAPENSIERVDALVLSGGSAFGLDAPGGVQAALREAGRGFEIRGIRVPLVPGAILFDLANGGNKDWGRFSPYRDLGYAAATAASHRPVAEGSVGAGTGATTATVKGGFGCASETTAAGHRVTALIAVNAAGAPTVGEGRWFWAAPFERDREFGGLGWPSGMPPDAHALRTKGTRIPSTTIGAVVTDTALTRPQAKRLAIMAHDGLARAVLPAHAPMDGDTIFAASTGARRLNDPVGELTALGHAAAIAVARAIGRGVYAAAALPVPGAQASWRDRFG